MKPKARQLHSVYRDMDADTLPAARTHHPDGADNEGSLIVSAGYHAERPTLTPRVEAVCREFGICPNREWVTLVDQLSLNIAPGMITLISGPSGSGKTTLLRQIENQCPGAIAVERDGLPLGTPIVEVIGSDAELVDVLQLLSSCGLGEPRLWVRCCEELSMGERFRASLAWSLSHLIRSDGPVVCDEFAALLHRRAAKTIAYNLRSLACRRKLSLVLATSNTDFASDLQPDQHVRLIPGQSPEITNHTPRRKPISLRRRLTVERAGKRDYEAFSEMHYRRTDELGFVDRVYVLRETSSGCNLAIVVYCYPPLELFLRNRAIQDRHKKNPKRLNQEVRIIRRLVVHPDLRGCGLGAYLLKKTMPLLGVPYIECLSSMGSINPVFERAGMKHIGLCPVSASRQALARRLVQLGADPLAADFAMHVEHRPQVHKVAAQLVYEWYQSTTGDGKRRVQRQSPRLIAQIARGLVHLRPVYYLWTSPAYQRSQH